MLNVGRTAIAVPESEWRLPFGRIKTGMEVESFGDALRLALGGDLIITLQK